MLELSFYNIRGDALSCVALGLTVLEGLLCTLFCLLLVSRRRIDGCVCPPVQTAGDLGGKDSLFCSRNTFVYAWKFLGCGGSSVRPLLA